MQRSSETIGAIAAALAKAQAELINPEKSLVATIRASSSRETDQTFRYAALSSGLDIVRKALGGHEIATIQTTAIDKEAGLIRLTTTLAHSSGEWLSSEWPVCAIGETTPRRMGVALTYARRYALFTLVGIAGEDDLDAPDLNAKTQATPTFEPATLEGSVLLQPSKVAERGPSAAPTHGRGKKAVRPARTTLDAQQSAALREQLIADVGRLQSADDAAEWVHRNLPRKNTLRAADADLLEENFRDRLSAIESASAMLEQELQAAQGEDIFASPEIPFFDQKENTTESPIVLHGTPAGAQRRVAAKTIRLRDKEHCKFVVSQSCLVCGRTPTEAHHLRFAQPRALGRKASDEYTVPVCRLHHRELHRYGDEASWWAAVSIDPLPIALALWKRSQLGATAEDCKTSENPSVSGRANMARKQESLDASESESGNSGPCSRRQNND
jgi:ERF superfamily